MAHSVYLGGSEVHLTNYEYKILTLLAQNVGKTLTHNFIISKVWGPGGNDANGLRVFMAGIRRKIEKDPYSQEFIRTDVGVGYRMNKIWKKSPEATAFGPFFILNADGRRLNAILTRRRAIFIPN